MMQNGTLPSGLLTSLKRFAKPTITSLLYHSGFYGWQIRNRDHKGWALILNYHRVDGQTTFDGSDCTSFERGIVRERFEQHMAFLRGYLRPTPLAEIADCIRKRRPIPPRTVAVTFDDGYQDNYTVAYPILKHYQIPATIFVITDLIGTSMLAWWDTVSEWVKRTKRPRLDLSRLRPQVKGIELSKDGVCQLSSTRQKEKVIELLCAWGRGLSPDENSLFLVSLQEQLEVPNTEFASQNQMITWDQAREMSRDLISIESHTHTHPNLSRMGIAELRQELLVSKELIESSIRQPVRGFAYPYGYAYQDLDRLSRVVKELNYTYGCLVENSAVDLNQSPYRMNRLFVPNVPLSVLVRETLMAAKETDSNAD